MSKLPGAMAQAAAYPTDVRMQWNAGYAAEAEGKLEVALKYFDAAFVLGLPIDGRYRFYFSYGKALRKQGRLEDSEEVFRMAIDEFPSDKAFPVHLAMTLDQAGKSSEAVAQLLEILIRVRTQVIDMAEHKPEMVAYLDQLGFVSSAADD